MLSNYGNPLYLAHAKALGADGYLLKGCSREDLLTLPGVTDHDADHIISERPFDNTHDLVTRHVLPESEYEKIRDRVIADR